MLLAKSLARSDKVEMSSAWALQVVFSARLEAKFNILAVKNIA